MIKHGPPPAPLSMSVSGQSIRPSPRGSFSETLPSPQRIETGSYSPTYDSIAPLSSRSFAPETSTRGGQHRRRYTIDEVFAKLEEKSAVAGAPQPRRSITFDDVVAKLQEKLANTQARRRSLSGSTYDRPWRTANNSASPRSTTTTRRFSKISSFKPPDLEFQSSQGWNAIAPLSTSMLDTGHAEETPSSIAPFTKSLFESTRAGDGSPSYLTELVGLLHAEPEVAQHLSTQQGCAGVPATETRDAGASKVLSADSPVPVDGTAEPSVRLDSTRAGVTPPGTQLGSTMHDDEAHRINGPATTLTASRDPSGSWPSQPSHASEQLEALAGSNQGNDTVSRATRGADSGRRRSRRGSRSEADGRIGEIYRAYNMDAPEGDNNAQKGSSAGHRRPSKPNTMSDIVPGGESSRREVASRPRRGSINDGATGSDRVAKPGLTLDEVAIAQRISTTTYGPLVASPPKEPVASSRPRPDSQQVPRSVRRHLERNAVSSHAPSRPKGHARVRTLDNEAGKLLELLEDLRRQSRTTNVVHHASVLEQRQVLVGMLGEELSPEMRERVSNLHDLASITALIDEMRAHMHTRREPRVPATAAPASWHGESRGTWERVGIVDKEFLRRHASM